MFEGAGERARQGRICYVYVLLPLILKEDRWQINTVVCRPYSPTGNDEVILCNKTARGFDNLSFVV